MGLALNGEMRDVVMLFEALEDMSRLFRELNEELATQRSIIARLTAERDAARENFLRCRDERGALENALEQLQARQQDLYTVERV